MDLTESVCEDVSDNDENDDSQIQYSEEVILCVYFKKNYFSAASFHTETWELNYMNSVLGDDSLSHYYVDLLYEQVDPNVIITNSNSSNDFIEYLKNLVLNDDMKAVTLHLIGGKYFNYDVCKNKVLEMNIVRTERWLGKLKELFIKSSLNFSDESLISCVGGLLYYVESNHSSNLQIRKIYPLSLENHLVMNEKTLMEIQVFDPLDHPAGLKWSTKSHRDGLSIYKLMQELCGRISLSGLRLFLCHPINNANILRERYEIIRFLVQPANQSFLQNLRRFLHNLSPLTVFRSKISTPSLRGYDWKVIYRNIHFAARVAEMCRDHANTVTFFKKVSDLLTQDIYKLANFIHNTIDFDAMEENDKYIVKQGVSKELDDAKSKVALLQKTIDAIIPYEFKILPDFINKIQVVYITELQFLLQIPYWKADLSEEDLHLPNLEYKFSSCKVAYYKSWRCKEMDRLLGDPLLEVVEAESDITLSLLDCINVHFPIFETLFTKLSELDCLASLAVLSKEYDYTEPELIEENSIVIEAGRHPLVCLTSDFVANDYFSSTGCRVKLLHGPNSSGKTVYIKQIALIVYLAHIGSFVPAKRVSLPTLDHIEVLLHTYESVATGCSAFFSELITMCSMMNSNGKKRLLLIDEVGTGTDEECAPVIAQIFLQHCIKSADQPHVIVSTHHRVIGPRFNPPELAVYGMEYVLQEGELIFSYRIKHGLPQISFAFHVAQKCGFPPDNIYAANTVLKWLKNGKQGLPPTLLKQRRYLQSLELLNKFCQLDLNDVDNPQEILHQMERSIKKIYMDTRPVSSKSSSKLTF